MNHPPNELELILKELNQLSLRVANLESLIQELSSRLEQLEQTKQTKAFKAFDLDRSK